MYTNLSASIDFNTAATQAVVPAVIGKRVVVYGFVLVNGVATAQTVQFKSGASNLSGVLALQSAVGGATSSHVGDASLALFVTDPGAALSMVMSAATQVGGFVLYQLVSG